MNRQEEKICAGCCRLAGIDADESLCLECLEQMKGNELVWESEEDYTSEN